MAAAAQAFLLCNSKPLLDEENNKLPFQNIFVQGRKAPPFSYTISSIFG